MEWWGWLLLVPVILVLLFLWIVMLAVGDVLKDMGSDVLRHPAIAGRIERRPNLFRIGGGLIAVGLLPVVATISARLKHQYDPAPGTMHVLALVVAALISLGMVILLIWWRIAEPEK